MRVEFVSLTAIVIAGLVSATSYPTNAHKTIFRDVCIFGGGASGSHAAIQLRDAGKSVVLVERQDHLGGHSHAYHDPVNGGKADYGVQIFQNVSLIRDFYARYNIPLKPAFGVPGVTITADFLTGTKVDIPTYSTNETLAAWERYVALQVKYSYLDDGAYLPDPVPKELLLPFNAIVKKYDLQPLVANFNIFFQGWPTFDKLSFLFILRYMSKSLVEGITTGTLVRSGTNDNGEVYRAVQDELGKDVLLSSTIVHAERSATQSVQKTWVETPEGIVLVQAKKILVTVPTVPSNMAGLQPDHRESSLYEKLRPMNHWTGLLRHTQIPEDVTIYNTGKKTTYHSIELPGSSGYTPTPDNLLHGFVYTSYESTDRTETEHRVLEEIGRLRSHGTMNGTSRPEFAAIKHHSNYALTVSPKDVADGFYRRLYALQGYRATYYGGAEFASQGTVPVFNYTVNHVLPLLLKD